MKPRLSPTKQSITVSASNLYLKNCVSETRINKKDVNAAYTFKLKSPNATKKKKSDPVALFQQTSTAWKKDRFLTSRGNNK